MRPTKKNQAVKRLICYEGGKIKKKVKALVAMQWYCRAGFQFGSTIVFVQTVFFLTKKYSKFQFFLFVFAHQKRYI